MIELDKFTYEELLEIQDLIEEELERLYDNKKKFGHNNLEDYYIRKINTFTVLKVKVNEFIPEAKKLKMKKYFDKFNK